MRRLTLIALVSFIATANLQARLEETEQQLSDRLAQIRSRTLETASDYTLAEADALKLLNTHRSSSATEEVYTAVEKLYAKNIGAYPQKVSEYCEKALHDAPHDAEKCRLYLDWGAALEKQQESNTNKTSTSTRSEISSLYFRAWNIIFNNNVPETLEELPSVEKYRCVPESDPACQAMEKRHMDEMKAWETARIRNDLVLYRSTVVGRIVMLYRNSPEALRELEDEAFNELQDPMSAKEFLRRVRVLFFE